MENKPPQGNFLTVPFLSPAVGGTSRAFKNPNPKKPTGSILYENRHNPDSIEKQLMKNHSVRNKT